MGVSLKPSLLVEVTRLIDDEDVIIKEARFELYDYNGTQAPSLAAKLALDQGDGEEVLNYASLGKAATANWLPADDGKTLTPVGKATGLANNSNWAIFVSALVNAGFPESRIEDDISCFEGLEGHVIRIPAPERKGLAKKRDDQTVLVINKIHKLPWEKNKGKGKSSSPSKSSEKKSPSTSSDSGSNVSEKASSFILGVLAKYPDGIEKSLLPTEAFAMLKDDPDRNAIVKLIFEDEFLNSSDNWKLEGGKVLPTE